MSEERLQKILARAGVASRRRVEEMIQEGRVTVNGQVAELGQKADPERDAVKVDGKRIHLQVDGPHTYLLLNKPRGVMSTVSDPEGRPTVMDLVPPPLRKALVPVGRLDFLTEGLLLLTDDGEFAHRISHPRFGCTKTYEVKVKGRPDEKSLDRIRQGMVIDGRRTAPVTVEPRTGRPGYRTGENTWWLVGLTEGRTRQIREMFFRVGHPVQRLRRVAIGPLSDPNLPVGQVRELTSAEVERLRDPQAGGGGKKKAAKKPPGKGWARAKSAAPPGKGKSGARTRRGGEKNAGAEKGGSGKTSPGSRAPGRGGPKGGGPNRGGPKRGGPNRGGSARGGRGGGGRGRG